jgi:hypothetical protein
VLADGAACYADFESIALIHFLRVIDEGLFQRAVGFDPALKTWYDACEKWLARSD